MMPLTKDKRLAFASHLTSKYPEDKRRAMQAILDDGLKKEQFRIAKERLDQGDYDGVDAALSEAEAIDREEIDRLEQMGQTRPGKPSEPVAVFPTG